MHPLNLSRLAFGCDDIDVLRERHRARAVDGATWIETRYRPTRHTELIGGSLFWIIRHQWVARQEILGFAEVDGRCRILLAADVVPVRPRPKRAHQGWRYLPGDDAPTDFDAADEDLAAMPAPMASELAALGLL
ncbi:hypothetical protein FHS31_003139 [Sphingomonas vulcanisoli]|uniref:DUF1489 family protein n=1 Tax=Sphingomonas vulcanisoli TaxID=1658060 RepID=A0ABX0U0T2_9SPHN|nr:DUF1489 domain-containing protein [Sphingomonas vulcanisoli]NIJ09506.1 hypothetical protein [Sphingomonas vulcanisoli]